MKKALLRIGIGLVVLLVLAVLATSLFLDGAVKRAVETIGPRLTEVDVKLDSVNLSLFSGSGKIKGLVVGNPKGYKTSEAIHLGTASLALQPGSLLSDKIIIRSIIVEAPEITFEGGFGGNNLSQIRANVDSAARGETTTTNTGSASQKPGKKLQVDQFLITGAKLHVSVTGMVGESLPVPLPDIHLADLGKGPDGITGAELTKLVLSAIEKAAIKVADQTIADLGKGATGLTKSLGTNAPGNAGKLGKSLGDIFKKK